MDVKLIVQSDGYLVKASGKTEISLPLAMVARTDSILQHGLSIKTVAPLTVHAIGSDTIDGETSIELPEYGAVVLIPLFNEEAGKMYWSRL